MEEIKKLQHMFGCKQGMAPRKSPPFNNTSPQLVTKTHDKR